MFTHTKAFSGFSVNDIAQAKEFYKETLGIIVEEIPEGCMLKIEGSNGIFVYEKQDHVPATYTILNFPVKDIDSAVDQLAAKGVVFQHYDTEWLETDKKGIARGEPNIAWFTDPAGNFLSVIQEAKTV